MFLDERIDNVSTGDTSPSFHPHWNTALLDVDQVIGNHETITFVTLHGALLLFTLNPSLIFLQSLADVWPAHYLSHIAIAVPRRLSPLLACFGGGS